MQKKTIVLSDFGATKYFYPKESIDVDIDRYNIVILEIQRIIKKCQKRGRDGLSRYDKRRFSAIRRGVCLRCGNPYNNTTTVLCQECTSNAKAQHNERTQQLRSQHRCITCGILLSSECNTTRCTKCNKRSNVLKKRH